MADQAVTQNLGDMEIEGIQAIINSALVSYERLPMLEVVFDRLVRLMTTSAAQLHLRQRRGLARQHHLAALRRLPELDPAAGDAGVFKAEEWDNYGLMTVDSALIYSIVDVLLGGRRGTAAMRIEGRPYTTIERNLVERMIEVVLADLTPPSSRCRPVTFRFDRLETNPRFATISRPANAAILVRLRIDMEDRGGKLELLLPYATLEPVRELLLQMFMGEKFGRDSIWETHLAFHCRHRAGRRRPESPQGRQRHGRRGALEECRRRLPAGRRNGLSGEEG
jgi:flagellar motor switch protein FliM